MCGRYGLWAQPADLEQRFDSEIDFDYEPRYNIAPEGPGLTAIKNESPDKINQLQWGLLPHWVDDPEDFPDLINARGETVSEKPAFRDAFDKRRCLIPANNFYEWTGRKGNRVPYYIGVEDQDLFAIAGIWETWSENGTEIQSAAIITTDANDVVDELHGRMPVILDRDEEERWLESDNEDELHAFIDPFQDDRTKAYEVSKAVNNPANEGPKLVEPIGSDQSGLGQFS